MRLLVLSLLSLLIAGCAAKAMPPPESPAAPPPPGVRADPVVRAMWAVRTFDEKPAWLAAQTALAPTEGTWGERLATAVSRALDARRVDSQVIPKDTTPAQMTALFDKGLQYLCEGTLTTLTAANGTATLRVAYRLKRRVNQDTRTVQARALEAALPIKTLDEAAMQTLVDAAAEKIADAVVADVPADLLAIRG